ncbi:MAG: hypothetical protein R3Y65_08785 [Bacillota bacterium]
MQTSNNNNTNHENPQDIHHSDCHFGCFTADEKAEHLSGGFAKPDREILHTVAKTTSMAIESLKDLVSNMEDCTPDCTDVLKCQSDCYKAIYRETKTALEAIDEDADNIGNMQKMMLWSHAKWDMMRDDSNSHIAELLIRGTAMGVCEVGKAMNDYKDVSTYSARYLGDKTMHVMSEFVDQLKKML